MRRLWLTLLGADAFFVLCTFYAEAGFAGADGLRPLNLAKEMSVATWFAGFQLLLFAMLAHSLSLEIRQRDAGAGRAWLLLSLIGLLLFADEVGSIHERAEYILPLRSSVAMAVLGLPGAAALLYALGLMRRSSGVTGKAPWLVLAGFVAFAAVWGLEVAEGLRLSPIQSGLRFALEEGTEFLGMLLLLAAIVSNKRRLGTLSGGIRDFLPRRQTLVSLACLAALLSVPLIALRARWTFEELRIPRRGDFGALIPILLYAAAGMLAVKRALDAPRGAWRLWILGALLFLLSIDAEYHLHQLLEAGREAGRWRNDVALLWALPLLAVALLAAPLRHRAWVVPIAAAVFAIAWRSAATASSDAAVLIALPYVPSFGAFWMIGVEAPCSTDGWKMET